MLETTFTTLIYAYSLAIIIFLIIKLNRKKVIGFKTLFLLIPSFVLTIIVLIFGQFDNNEIIKKTFLLMSQIGMVIALISICYFCKHAVTISNN